jgi:hypothetical protein
MKKMKIFCKYTFRIEQNNVVGGRRGADLRSCKVPPGGYMETSGQNLLEQKFEWDLTESLFVTNVIFPPKEKAM